MDGVRESASGFFGKSSSSSKCLDPPILSDTKSTSYRRQRIKLIRSIPATWFRLQPKGISDLRKITQVIGSSRCFLPRTD